jgi:tRNA (guanine-N7-)-methyltransferase
MMDWSTFYPAFMVAPDDTKSGMTHNTHESEAISTRLTKQVEVADIGCGFGGLLVALGPRFPDTLFLGTGPITISYTLHTVSLIA